MTTNEPRWSDWIETVPGEPCPIPDAKGGEYQIRWGNGMETSGLVRASFWSRGTRDWWKQENPDHSCNIIAYRTLIKEPRS